MPLKQAIIAFGSVQQARQRIEDRLCVVGDVWFPTRNEMRRWADSPAPLYVKWTRGDGFEIGPRLETIPAARLVPVLRGRIQTLGQDQFTISARLTWPWLTQLVMLGFAVSLVAWGIFVISDYIEGTTHAGWVGAWAASLVGVHGSAIVAWVWGRRRLRSDLPWLREVLERPIVAGEDWED